MAVAAYFGHVAPVVDDSPADRLAWTAAVVGAWAWVITAFAVAALAFLTARSSTPGVLARVYDLLSIIAAATVVIVPVVGLIPRGLPGSTAIVGNLGVTVIGLSVLYLLRAGATAARSAGPH